VVIPGYGDRLVRRDEAGVRNPELSSTRGCAAGEPVNNEDTELDLTMFPPVSFSKRDIEDLASSSTPPAADWPLLRRDTSPWSFNRSFRPPDTDRRIPVTEDGDCPTPFAWKAGGRPSYSPPPSLGEVP
jgi:hypothetical protein